MKDKQVQELGISALDIRARAQDDSQLESVSKELLPQVEKTLVLYPLTNPVYFKRHMVAIARGVPFTQVFHRIPITILNDAVDPRHHGDESLPAVDGISSDIL